MFTKSFEVFKEIAVGGKSKEKLLERLSASGIQFNKYAYLLFEHSDFSPPETIETIKLVKTTLVEMGLEESCTYDEFISRSTSYGLRLCPLYLAAFLRLEYTEQREEQYLTIASPKPESHEDFPCGFYLRNRDSTLWLRGYKADSFEGWPGFNEFIFIKEL